jgi:hypothetical protein
MDDDTDPREEIVCFEADIEQLAETIDLRLVGGRNVGG